MLAIERSVCGCDYGGNSWTTRAEAQQKAARLGLSSGMRVLDLGAGAGWPGLYMAKTSGCDVALVDLPLAGLRIAAERADNDGVPENLWENLRAVVADAASLPFPDGSYDAISHSDLLCCLRQKRSVLRACRRVIRRRGRMVFTVISVAPGLSARQYARAVANGPEFVETATDYPTLLARTGWIIADHEDITMAFAASCRRQLHADEVHQAGLVALIGAAEFTRRVAGWRSKTEAIADNLLRREMFVVTPKPNYTQAPTVAD